MMEPCERSGLKEGHEVAQGSRRATSARAAACSSHREAIWRNSFFWKFSLCEYRRFRVFCALRGLAVVRTTCFVLRMS